MRLATTCMLALVFIPLHHVAAQERVTQMEPGAVVRIAAPDVLARSKPVIGTLVSADPDTLVLRTERDGTTLRIPVEAVRRVKVWDRRARKSAVRAALISASLGATVALGALTVDRAGQSLPEAASWPGGLLVGVGLLAGPSAPSWYAGNHELALAHLGVTAAMAAGLLASLCLEDCTTAQERGMLIFSGLYALNWLIGAVDGALGAARYRRWVEVPSDRFRAEVIPLRGSQLGVGVSLRF